ncbi:MAG: GNAT family N-acetyltransferase [Rickettsiales bacterium]|jgi:ribosomal protein S18 acetylase RimI-like enzyme|nr:GNAT family N-acetyltransferase [Rickettsiales bacterium]
MIIRNAQPKDFDAIKELQKIGVLTFGAGSDAEISFSDIDLQNQIDAQRGIVLVAEQNNKIIAFVFGENFVNPTWAMGSYFTVHPDFRGTDVYKKIMDAFAARVKENGGKYLVLYADSQNPRLVNFYKRFGFVAGETFVEMIKEL